MPSLQAAHDANAQFESSYIPVAVFVGGTSGCGEAMAKALASHTGGRAHIIIVGRNRANAEKTFASMPRPNDDVGNPVLREFLFCEATLMRNIRATCLKIGGLVDRINFLSLSAGYMNYNTVRDETDEGIDKLLAMRYYNRFKFILELLPLLENASAAGQAAHAMSMLTIAPMNLTLDLDDLDMRKSYGFWRLALHPTVYNDIMVEEFSKRHPTVAFTHISPGNVATPGKALVRPMLILRPLVFLINYFFSERVEVAGEYMLYSLLHAEKGKWYRRNRFGDDVGPKLFTAGYNEAVWEHSLKVAQVTS
ncbi:hypothetical protein CYLTODRAFT_388609 [Cylindrobasidium torrendii FP15055 ss-10]|uniref:NAD(P)-binding protein n=1 Tax=Cylindrobasidium torrendii FP15055 ss-10 TaxID=1314674 RepID=A0A0D7BQI8_9AGAR|nr:hypothetical protein CYLTODRAFT_388609 [Cylindrobasidium torrendii FP15055 ss-10]